MSTKTLLIFTLDTKKGEVKPYFQSHKQKKNFDFPYSFTKGFRQIFWKVFNTILEKSIDKEAELRIFNQKLILSHITIFVTIQVSKASFKRYEDVLV